MVIDVIRGILQVKPGVCGGVYDGNVASKTEAMRWMAWWLLASWLLRVVDDENGCSGSAMCRCCDL